MRRRIDLHVHTRFSEWKHLRVIHPRDSYNEPMDVYQRCKAAGMDVVAITDHDTIEGALDLLSSHPELEPEIVIGEEVEARFPDTNQWVHVNVFGLDESIHDDLTRLRGDVHEMVAYLKQRRLFHVLNHPFQSYFLQKPPARYLHEILSLFEFFEVGNGTLPARHDKAVAEMIDVAAAFYLTRHGVAGSDAHDHRDIARCWTEVDLPDDADAACTKDALFAALARGEGRAAGGRIGPLTLTANVYRIIGRYYMSLLQPANRRDLGVSGWLGAALLAPACVAGVPAIVTLGNALRVEAVVTQIRRELSRMERSDLRMPLAQEPSVEDS